MYIQITNFFWTTLDTLVHFSNLFLADFKRQLLNELIFLTWYICKLINIKKLCIIKSSFSSFLNVYKQKIPPENGKDYIYIL